MNTIVTGGAGFIGRWVVKRLLDDGNDVWVLDNLSNGRNENLAEFKEHQNLKEFVIGDIKDKNILSRLFENDFDVCFHLAASINVQDSIDNPRETFDNDVLGTFNMLEEARRKGTKFVLMSTCLVYDKTTGSEAISESHPVKPASPYAGSKLAAENITLSYYYAYNLPTVVIRPFNTYGPFQKSTGEGGVISIFIRRNLARKTLNIYGDGTQTRDFLYVEDCADFTVKAGYADEANGEIINAGLGRDVTINELASIIADEPSRIKHVPHIHPQSEIQKLLCDYTKARNILRWQPKVSLEEGIQRTTEWLKTVNGFG